MPEAVLVTIAEAVKAALNAGSYSQSFTATRTWLPRFELRDLEAITVTVWPNDQVNEFATRDKTNRLYTVDVAVMQKVDVDANTGPDALMLLVEEIGSDLHGKQLVGYTSAFCLRWELVPMVDWEQMKTNRAFMSVLRFTYKRVA